MRRIYCGLLLTCVSLMVGISHGAAQSLSRLKYNHPGLEVDLGVGLWAWPLPIDFDDDGDLDLVVSCPDVPFAGTYFFENTGRIDSQHSSMQVFEPPRRICDPLRNVQLSIVDKTPWIATPGMYAAKLGKDGLIDPISFGLNTKDVHDSSRIRANQWKLADWDGDGRVDLLIGVGDWQEYGWDNAFDADGNWTRGPLHGYVYWIRNQGTLADPEFDEPRRLLADGNPIDVYGMPSPNAADFDGDGDLDLLCGEFVDRFTYFENVGSRQQPEMAAGRRLSHNGDQIRMDLQMIVPVAIDWDGDGDTDLIVGDEDGRVAFIEHTGVISQGLPLFNPPRYFRQVADEVKFGALITPVACDWDDDGDQDLICGNTAGYVGFVENLDGGNPPKWAEPVRLKAGDKTLRIQAGANGSIQGPCEAKWGYTTLSVADWDHDGRLDVVVNSIWGKIEWYRNEGTREQPRLAEAASVRVDWVDGPPKPAWNWWQPQPNELATQWRTTPLVHDLNGDRLNDLISLDHEGYLSFYRRLDNERQTLAAGERIFLIDRDSTYDSRHRVMDADGGALRLNGNSAGGSGRRKMCLCDWDGDGQIDLMVNSPSIHWLQQTGQDAQGRIKLTDRGAVTPHRLAGHTTSPTTVDFDGNGVNDLLIGAEDGYLYLLENDRQGR